MTGRGDATENGLGAEDHEIFDELAVGWALYALEPDDETLFAEHLHTCRRCARTVIETTEVMGALAFAPSAAEPSAGLRDRLLAAAAETEQVPRPEEPADTRAPGDPRAPGDAREAADAGASEDVPEPEDGRQQPRDPGGAAEVPGPGERDEPAAGAVPDRRPARVRVVPDGGPAEPRPSWRRIVPNALVAAAVAAVLALGTWNVVVRSERDDAVATAAERQQMLTTLLEPGTAVIAPILDDDGTVATLVARDAQVQVVSTALEVNDRDSETYVVWGMTQIGATPLGTFDVVRSQMDLRTVGSSATGLDDYTAYAISREPGRSAPSTPTEVVGRGQVTS